MALMACAAVSWKKVGRWCDRGLFGERLRVWKKEYMHLFCIDAISMHAKRHSPWH
jgi:hypothetical protein